MTHSCTTHQPYMLTCEQYEDLIGDGTCWRCGSVVDAIHVDHDHALGINAVRGALCAPCNGHMAIVDAGRIEPDHLDISYRAKTWHIGRVAEYRPDTRTPIRNFRVDEELWSAALAKAKRNRTTISAVVNQRLAAYVDED